MYEPVDPTIAQQTATIRQHSTSGNALIGASGQILDNTDAKVIVAANGGSDLIYVPDHNFKPCSPDRALPYFFRTTLAAFRGRRLRANTWVSSLKFH